MDRFRIPKVGLSVKWGLSYCPKYDRYSTCSMCHRRLRSYRSFIEWKGFLRFCTLYGSTLLASLRRREQTPIEVSVSKAHFMIYLRLQNDQKEFRNDCAACPVLSWQYRAGSAITAVHPECQNIFFVTNRLQVAWNLKKLRVRISASLNWNKGCDLLKFNYFLGRVRRRWNDFRILKVWLSL